jgi:hypothetical protein
MSKNKYQRQRAMHEPTAGFKYQKKPIQEQSINMKGSIVFQGGAARFQTLGIQYNKRILMA